MSDVTGGDFLAQNDLFREGLTEDDYEMVHAFADHHAGGLIVLWRPFDVDGLSVKAHDSWGGDDDIVVHVYDSEDPDRQWMRFFDNGHDALNAFLSVTEADLTSDEWEEFA